MTDKLYMEWAKVPPSTTVPFIGHSTGPPTASYFQPDANMDTSKEVSDMSFIDIKSGSQAQLKADNIVTLSKSKKLQPTTNIRPNLPRGSGVPNQFSLNVKLPDDGNAKKSKAFVEDLSPIHLDEDDTFGIDLRKGSQKPVFTPETPATKFTEGEVKYTTKEALFDMMQQLSNIKLRNTGCVINETCDPECAQYEENVHFVTSDTLGQGSFGKVDLCYDSQTKKPFVRKTLRKEHLRGSEVIAPTTFDHPNLTKFFGLVQRDSAKNLQQATMELYLEYGGDSLTKIYQRGQRFDQTQIRNLTKQGLEGLIHMDRYSIIHLDIKPENICILEQNGTPQLKITDFGSSNLSKDRLEFVGVTPEYMAPEMCQLYLQRQASFGLDWGLEESDITGKVDIFSFALVTMYMYKGYHILVKVINNGQPTYMNIDANRRRALHVNLMIQMAKDTDNDFFVQNLIPDECSLDMRDLLIEMTHHKHENRVSAREAVDQIEAFEKRCKSAVSAERKVKHDLFVQKQPPQNLNMNIAYVPDNAFIPDVAEDCMESETGPVKNRTIGLLRRKLQPYEKGGHGYHGKGSKNMAPMSPQQEMLSLRHRIGSKNMQMPATPIQAFEELKLDQAMSPEPQRISGMTEMNAPLAQPSMDTTPTQCQPMNSVSVEESLGGFSSGVRDVSLSARNPAGKPIVITMDMLVKLLQKKQQIEAAAQGILQVQAASQREPEVRPPVINLEEYASVGKRRAQTQPVQQPMEEIEQPPVGNLPNLPFFE